jgi:hypothetical protein
VIVQAWQWIVNIFRISICWINTPYQWFDLSWRGKIEWECHIKQESQWLILCTSYLELLLKNCVQFLWTLTGQRIMIMLLLAVQTIFTSL